MRVSKFVATAGGAGLLPWAPGTWGSLVGLMLCILIGTLQKHTTILWIALILLFFIGLWASKKELENQPNGSQDFDPSYIVIDEVVGMMIAIACLSFVMTPRIIDVVISFGLFRFFDIVKPGPVGCIDRGMCVSKEYAHWGIMLDDVVAGVLAAVIHVIIMIF